MVFGFLPLIMLGAFFGLLPLAPLMKKRKGYEAIVEEEEEIEGSLFSQAADGTTFPARTPPKAASLNSLGAKLRQARGLFLP